MAVLGGNIIVRVGADLTSFNRGMARVEGRMAGVGGFARRALLGISAGFIGAGVASIRAAGNFEQSLNVFQSVAGATGREMRQVSALAKDLGRDMTLPATSAKDAADAMVELAKGGLTVRDTMRAAKGVLQLSAAAQIDNASAAQITARALNSFRLSGDQATHVADVLANAANKSTGEITDFGFALQMSSAVAARAGLSIEDTTAALMEMAQAGIVGSDAGTSLKQMLLNLTPTSKKARETMADLGVDLFNARGEFVGIRETVRQYQQALAALTPEQQQMALKTIFGSDAVRAANIVLGDGVEAFDRYRKAADEQGTASRVAAARMKGFNGAVESFKSALETLAITVGQQLLPEVTKAVRQFTEWITKWDESGRAARDTRAVLETVKPILADIVSLLRTSVSVLLKVIDLLGGFKNALIAVAAAMTAVKATRFADQLGLIGAQATTATGKVAALRGALLRLGAVGAIAVGVDLLVRFSPRDSHKPNIMVTPGGERVDLSKVSQAKLRQIIRDVARSPGKADDKRLAEFFATLPQLGHRLDEIESIRSSPAAFVARQVKRAQGSAKAKGQDAGRKIGKAAGEGLVSGIREGLEIPATVRGASPAAGAFGAFQRSVDLPGLVGGSVFKKGVMGGFNMRRQFRALGLTATGEALAPTRQALQRDLRKWETSFAGTVLDSNKNRNMIVRIRKVLSGELGALSREVRLKIKELLDAMSGGQTAGGLTPWSAPSTKKLTEGLGLTREQRAAFRQRLAGAGLVASSAPRMAVPSVPLLAGTTTITVNINGDGKEARQIARETIAALKKEKRRSAPQTRGRSGGHTLGLT